MGALGAIQALYMKVTACIDYACGTTALYIHVETDVWKWIQQVQIRSCNNVRLTV